MKRRSFLSLIGAASAAPVLPGQAFGAVAKTASYNRFMYGYAVFKARHGGAVVASDLAAALKVTSGQANAMIAEMTRDGILRKTTSGAVQAVTTHGGRLGPNGYLRKSARLAGEISDRFEGAAQKFVKCMDRKQKEAQPEYSQNTASLQPGENVKITVTES